MSQHRIAISFCLIAAASTARAETSVVVVDRVFQDGSFIHVLMRVPNDSAHEVDRIEVVCDVLDGKGAALGRGRDFLNSVPANETAVGEVLINAPPGGSEPVTAKCRVVR